MEEELKILLADKLSKRRDTTCRVVVERLAEFAKLEPTPQAASEMINFARAVMSDLWTDQQDMLR